MAKITDLPEAAEIDGSEVVPIVQGAAMRKTTLAGLVTPLVQAGAGKLNAWLDPFFREIAIGAAFDGKARWQGSTVPAYTLVDNPVFDGKAIRSEITGNGSLGGPVVYLSDFGAEPGDTITLRVLVTGNGAALQVPCRPRQGALLIDVQKLFLTPGGSNVAATSDAPQLMTATFEVPAGCDNIWIFPFTASAAARYEIVALWGYKGDVGDGPAWPMLDEPYWKVRLTSLDKAITGAVGAVDYAVEAIGEVTADSKTAVLTAINTSGETGPSALPFCGWGEMLAPSGETFNAIRVEHLQRSDTVAPENYWRTVNVVIRTGPTPATVASVVAVGSTIIPSGSRTLQDIDIILRDPLTGAVKTLTDADFSDGKYLLGVYTLDADGSLAPMGPVEGTLTNSLGQSYYHTNALGSAVTGEWKPWTANGRCGVTHLIMVNPEDATAYRPTPKFVADIGDIEPGPDPTENIDIVVPPVIYAGAGLEANAYLDSLVLGRGPDYLWDVTSAAGVQQDERWTLSTGGAVADVAITFKAFDPETRVQRGTASAIVRAAAAPAGAATTSKVLVIGDSQVQAGVITQTMLDNAAADVHGLELAGTRGAGANLHEGRGGWRVEDYATEGRTYHEFTVSGVTEAPALNSTTYTNNGATFTVQEMDLVGGAGTIVCSVTPLAGVPAASGDLTKSNGSAGDATIAFSASAPVPGNPFWIGGQLNFGQYLADNSITDLNGVVLLLGTNDVFGATSDQSASDTADGALAQLDDLVASIRDALPALPIGFGTIVPGAASQDAFGSNYGNGQPAWRVKANYVIWNRQLAAHFGGREAEDLYVLSSGTAVDRVNNFPRGAVAPVNSRNPDVTIARVNNGVHPAASGYQQIADSWWCWVKWLASL